MATSVGPVSGGVVSHIRSVTSAWLQHRGKQQGQIASSDAPSSAELRRVLQTTLLTRYAMSRSAAQQQQHYASMFPTPAETALVEAALVIEAAIKSQSSTVLPVAQGASSPLPSSMSLYQTVMAERYRYSLGYDRNGMRRRMLELWASEVRPTTKGNTLVAPYDESTLSTVLAVPRVGHAALGHLLVDAITFLQDVVGIRDLWLSAGTLLGAVRAHHTAAASAESSFIPWDDDLDVTTTEEGEAALLAFFGMLKVSHAIDTTVFDMSLAPRSDATPQPFECVHGARHWVVEHCPLFGYKLYDKNCTVPIGCPELLERGAMCFGAFVDIFVVAPQRRGSVLPSTVLELHRESAQETWPKEIYSASATFPLKPMPFYVPAPKPGGGATCWKLNVPHIPELYLDTLYGSDWSTIGFVPQQLHYGLVLPSDLRIEKASFLK